MEQPPRLLYLPGVLVSIITPTARRPSLLPLIYDCIRTQDWPEWEWLLHDQGDTPKDWGDPRVRHFCDPKPLTVGAKRNRLAQEARGEIIAHFDDDDYYAPHYLSEMVRRLGDAALVKQIGFHAYRVPDRQLGYWDLTQKRGRHYEWRAKHPVAERTFGVADAAELKDLHLGFGYSLVYRRAAWAEAPFRDVRFDEDGAFVRGVLRRHPIVGFKDTTGLSFAVQHRANCSVLFPQTMLDAAETAHLFPHADAHLRRLHEIFA